MMRVTSKAPFVAVTAALVLLGGCRGGISKSPPVHLNLDMDFQQKLKAQSESTFAGWADGRGMRLPAAGTVSRADFLGDPAQLVQTYDLSGDGKLDQGEASSLKVGGQSFAVADRNGDRLLDVAEITGFAKIYTYKNADGTYVAANPLPRSEDVLLRGRHIFNVNCAVCHGRSGTGGVVKRHWPVKVPSLVNDDDMPTRERLAGMAPGEMVGVITDSKGTMPSYARQISMADRWAVAHYVKALQQHFSQ